MPHNFIKTNASTPNPGLWTRERVEEIAQDHDGTFVSLFFDDPTEPEFAYMLIQDGDLDGLVKDLHAHEVQVLYSDEECEGA